MKIGWRANDGVRPDIELCGLGAIVVIWYGSRVFSHALALILEDGPTPTQSVYVRLSVCGSVCFVICSFLCLCVILCLCDNVHNEHLTNLTWCKGV